VEQLSWKADGPLTRSPSPLSGSVSQVHGQSRAVGLNDIMDNPTELEHFKVVCVCVWMGWRELICVRWLVSIHPHLPYHLLMHCVINPAAFLVAGISADKQTTAPGINCLPTEVVNHRPLLSSSSSLTSGTTYELTCLFGSFGPGITPIMITFSSL